jgi:two-component system cell cycle response regulator
MTARVLIVDDLVANIRLLEARLAAEYYEVLTAMNGPAALDICARGLCDIVLLDVMMPGMDGLEVCRRLKQNPMTAHIPVVMVTALDEPADRVAGLEAGADDFLTKPVNDIALITRVKSLVRLKMLTDDWIAQASTSTAIGLEDAVDSTKIDGDGGRILLVDRMAMAPPHLAQWIRPVSMVEVEPEQANCIGRTVPRTHEIRER